MDALRAWMNPALIVLCMYFIKGYFEELLANQKAMMTAVPVLQEQYRLLKAEVDNHSLILREHDRSLNTQLPKAIANNTKSFFIKPEETKLPQGDNN